MLLVFDGLLFVYGVDVVDVVDEFVVKVDFGFVVIFGGCFFGFVIGGMLFVVFVVDWFVFVWDQNLGFLVLIFVIVVVEWIVG